MEIVRANPVLMLWWWWWDTYYLSLMADKSKNNLESGSGELESRNRLVSLTLTALKGSISKYKYEIWILSGMEGISEYNRFIFNTVPALHTAVNLWNIHNWTEYNNDCSCPEFRSKFRNEKNILVVVGSCQIFSVCWGPKWINLKI